MTDTKLLLRALAGETLPTPPVWLMRQAGRYLPEYRATREQAGSFLDLCYNPELAIEVTLQPIRRFGFDAAILFADILLVPQALGCDLKFVQGEGPRLSTITDEAGVDGLAPVEGIHDTLSPVYETVKGLSEALPKETTLIGFAGAPWTVATYMVAGRGTPSQEPARRMIAERPDAFGRLIERVTEATIAYLEKQVEAGAEVVKIFDSWAGSLNWSDYERYCIAPNRQIVEALRARWPHLPIIGFPRGAGTGYEAFAEATGVSAVALDSSVNPAWAAERLQPKLCVQGNLDPLAMVIGGDFLVNETRKIVDGFSGGPFIFNLGHGITPDADPKNVELLLNTIRG
ncbi:uroporphyrinogen decarboxylase [Rhodovulum sp. DZ06]|uniref:uroporphyrinogen decarboxylase n=1 Tax=Rhodovulum sp. DZ06 TaxID=3425126 RepID=UPI003D349C93